MEEERLWVELTLEWKVSEGQSVGDEGTGQLIEMW